VAGRASGVKMGDERGGSLNSPDGVALSQIVGVCASDISRSTIKSRIQKISSGTSSPELSWIKSNYPSFLPILKAWQGTQKT